MIYFYWLLDLLHHKQGSFYVFYINHGIQIRVNGQLTQKLVKKIEIVSLCGDFIVINISQRLISLMGLLDTQQGVFDIQGSIFVIYDC